MKRPFRTLFSLSLCGIAAMCMGGNCNIDLDDLLDDLENIQIVVNNNNVTNIQEIDPTQPDAPLPGGFVDTGDSIFISDDAFIITDIDQPLAGAIEETTLLGFDNQTGFDVFIEYEVDGVLQGVLVFDGELLLIDYPCVLVEVRLLFETDFAPDGTIVDEFALDDIFFENGFDYFCGDAVIISIFFDEITVDIDLIELI